MAEPRFQPIKPEWNLSLDDYIAALAVSPVGEQAAVLGGEGGLWFLDPRKGAVLRGGEAHPMGGLVAAYSPSGKVLVTGGQERAARMWNAATGETVAELALSSGSSVDVLRWAPGKPLLATASGKQVGIWSEDGRLLFTLPHGDFAVAAVAWDAIGERLATACFDGIRLWDAASGELLKFYETGVSILSMEWCPRREIIVGGTQEATMLIWNIGGDDAFQAGPFEVKMRELSFHYSGDYLVTGGGTDVTLWDFSRPDMQGERPVYLEAHQQLISVLTWQGAGPLFASGGRDGAVYIWKPLQAKQPLVYTHLETPVTALAWQARDSGVLAATESGTVASIPAPGRG